MFQQRVIFKIAIAATAFLLFACEQTEDAAPDLPADWQGAVPDSTDKCSVCPSAASPLMPAGGVGGASKMKRFAFKFFAGNLPGAPVWVTRTGGAYAAHPGTAANSSTKHMLP